MAGKWLKGEPDVVAAMVKVDKEDYDYDKMAIPFIDVTATFSANSEKSSPGKNEQDTPVVWKNKSLSLTC